MSAYRKLVGYFFYFQGQLPMEVIPSFTGIEDVQTEEGKPMTVHPQSLKPQQSNGTDVPSHKVESPSTVDPELTESASTGEVPSPITFRLVHVSSKHMVYATVYFVT